MKLLKTNILFLLLFSVFAISYTQEIVLPEVPNPPRLVNNFSKSSPNFLSSGEAQCLEEKLTNFDKQTSNQIAIAIVDGFSGTSANDFSNRLFQKWGIGGDREKSNGVLIVVKPKTASSRGDIYIVAGYGLEGAIPDIIAKRIVENTIIPHFKKAQYFKGLDAATTEIMQRAIGEFNEKREVPPSSPFPTILIIILIIILMNWLSRKGKRGYMGQTINRRGVQDNDWPLFGGGAWGGGHTRGRGFGGGGDFGGGGFGGFGGGSSGGGGAGGSW